VPTSIKRLILPVSVSDDNFNGFDHAVVDLTQSDIQLIRDMCTVVNTCKLKLGNEIYKLVCFDNDITVMATDYDTDYLDNGRTPLKTPDDEDSRIDCVCLNVTHDDFFWSFSLKHSEFRCETKSTPITALDTFDTLDCREVPSDSKQ